MLAKLSILILVGKGDSKADGDAKHLDNACKKYHREVPAAKRQEFQDLFFSKVVTSAPGQQVLAAGLNVDTLIGDFIKYPLGEQGQRVSLETAR